MATIPSLMAKHSPCADTCLSFQDHQDKGTQLTANNSSGQHPQTPRAVVGMKTRMRQAWISSALNHLGIHCRRSVYYLQHKGPAGRLEYVEDSSAISESYEILFTWSLFRYGIVWSRHCAYTISSLSSYPLIEDLWDFRDLITRGTIRQIQQAFTAGDLHPFTRDRHGHSLFHVSIRKYTNMYSYSLEFRSQLHTADSIYAIYFNNMA